MIPGTLCKSSAGTLSNVRTNARQRACTVEQVGRSILISIVAVESSSMHRNTVLNEYDAGTSERTDTTIKTPLLKTWRNMHRRSGDSSQRKKRRETNITRLTGAAALLPQAAERTTRLRAGHRTKIASTNRTHAYLPPHRPPIVSRRHGWGLFEGRAATPSCADRSGRHSACWGLGELTEGNPKHIRALLRENQTASRQIDSRCAFRAAAAISTRRARP